MTVDSLKPILEVAADIGIPADALIPYGRWFAKVEAPQRGPSGRLILVTGMSPTPSGEGKTTVAIGLAQALRLLGRRAAACIRQPSLGPYFGSKGGATGGGLSEVLPADDISTQFTGDDATVTASHNLVASAIDNHIHFGNRLGIDSERIFWPRVTQLNDRELRRVVLASGRTGEFHISAASELMSILCLSRDIGELGEGVERIVLGLKKDGGPVTPQDLKVSGAAAFLLKNALLPNLAQSTEGAPVFIHGGPFGNISLGTSSIAATLAALSYSEYALVEAGFSTELGAEKFFDIKCRRFGLKPALAVIVATLRAIRHHGGAADFRKRDDDAAARGLSNLRRHIENIKRFGVRPVVVVNRFAADTDAEVSKLLKALSDEGVRAIDADVWGRGGSGGLEAARLITEEAGDGGSFKPLYPLDLKIEEKIGVIARQMYGASGVEFSGTALKDLEEIKRLGLSGLPVCMAKTPRSLSDDPALLGAPSGFTIKVDSLRPQAGAGYIVARCGQVLLMPGLPEHPLFETMT